jgi:hypothetical protein
MTATTATNRCSTNSRRPTPPRTHLSPVAVFTRPSVRPTGPQSIFERTLARGGASFPRGPAPAGGQSSQNICYQRFECHRPWRRMSARRMYVPASLIADPVAQVEVDDATVVGARARGGSWRWCRRPRKLAAWWAFKAGSQAVSILPISSPRSCHCGDRWCASVDHGGRRSG